MHLPACYDLSSYCSVQTRGANATNCVVVRLMLDMSSPPVPVGWGAAEQRGGSPARLAGGYAVIPSSSSPHVYPERPTRCVILLMSSTERLSILAQLLGSRYCFQTILYTAGIWTFLA